MAIETALEDVKVKEELKRGPDLEEEDRSKVVEGEGKDSAQRWQIVSVKSCWGHAISLKHVCKLACLLLFIFVEISVKTYPELSLRSLKHAIIYISN